MDRKISVAIPYYNNSKFMHETMTNIIAEPRINEIIICDDKSSDIDILKKIIEEFNTTKIKLFENQKNMGCYHNKINSVLKCTNSWCILLDSDNYIDASYLDKLFEIENWETDTIYIPDRPITFPGNPSANMDYRKYSIKIGFRRQ